MRKSGDFASTFACMFERRIVFSVAYSRKVEHNKNLAQSRLLLEEIC